ncbi:hypothetical protein F383_35031 [Gossypium arboreum]|uniref:Uncharacterized protein n=1 Tax=Gossypium arboreum TaxID=29729 RepID=A0A0B0PXC0_GOSAR|nr:hypothetical protein F383_35031 [Gossypium arboreum]
MATAPCTNAPQCTAVGRPKILPLVVETQVITRSLAEMRGTSFVWCLRREERARVSNPSRILLNFGPLRVWVSSV